jgi:acetolactate synthase-1/2/3 large subunit
MLRVVPTGRAVDLTRDPTPDAPRATLAAHLARMLWELGVRVMFGVTGREITPVWSSLQASERTNRRIVTIHSLGESGAGFAAIGSWARTGMPAGVYTTTGPGITNALTALEAGCRAGAQLILGTPLTPVDNRHRGAI